MPKAPRPFHLFILLLLIMCASKTINLYVVPLLAPQPGNLGNLIDSALLAALTAPFIWRFTIRPLRNASLKAIGHSQATVENSVDAVITFDALGIITSFNPAAARLLGYLPGEIIGRVVATIIPEKTAAGARSNGANLESVVYRKNGSAIAVGISISTLQIGRHLSYVVILHDIAERRRAEREILKAKEDWERTFDAIVDPVMILDTGHQIVKANKAMKALQGRWSDDGAGATCCYRMHGVDAPPAMCPHSRLLLDGEPHSEEIYDPRVGGHFLITVSPLFGPDGELQGSIHHARDITERKKLEKQLQHAQKMEAIATLAGGVAHDFNNILTAMIGYGTLAQMKLAKDHQVQAHIAAMLVAADRAADLTRSLLAFSRKQETVLKPFNLNDIVRNAQVMLRRLTREDIELRTEFSDRTLSVLADVGQIEQILMNFATNSQDAIAGTGVVTVKTEALLLDAAFKKHHGFGEPGNYAILTFTDSGKGMDELTRGRIFEPFYTTKELGKGTGLGLSIAYGVVKQHNGFISCSSEPGHGTVFRIYLPLIDAEAPVRESAYQAPLPSGLETILVAEDDDQTREFIREILEEFGYSVLTASNGEEAVLKLAAESGEVSLVVVDAIMPRMNGRETYREMRKVAPSIKVILISGYPASILKEKRIIETEVSFLPKPIHARDLLLSIRKLLD